MITNEEIESVGWEFLSALSIYVLPYNFDSKESYTLDYYPKSNKYQISELGEEIFWGTITTIEELKVITKCCTGYEQTSID